MGQEIKPKKSLITEKSEFAKNLQKGLEQQQQKEGKNGSDEKREENSVKIFEESKNQISAVRTKKLETKRPLFGRAYNTEKNLVKLKFLLNGVKDERDIFFYFPKSGQFGLQTTNGYAITEEILPKNSNKWN